MLERSPWVNPLHNQEPVTLTLVVKDELALPLIVLSIGTWLGLRLKRRFLVSEQSWDTQAAWWQAV